MKRLLKTFGVLIVVIASNCNAQPGATAAVQAGSKLERLRTHPVLPESTRNDAAQIKKDPRYNEAQEGKSANWAARAFKNLSKLWKRPPQPTTPNLPSPDLTGVGLIIRFVAWGLLAAAVFAFIYFVARYFRWKVTLAKRAQAVMDDDEPDRTLDEWLSLANDYERNGKYREAVRCLYLAALMKFDERGVAFFDRGQTNWEHLRRIEASPRLPSSLSFLQPTQDFDQIWYGFRVNGTSDVDKFRGYYNTVVEELRRGVAA
ncbi:MAG: hypothetical protein ABL949_11870 [Fimbriimonadaceae bacterium]